MMKKLLLPILFASFGLMTSCGDDCENIVCFNEGVCVDGTCDCPDGYTGTDCSQIVVNQGETISGDITADRTLVGNAIHNLSGRVVVRSGNTLTIEAGAILKFQDGQDISASALIIERGAKILAQGTAALPIIMTSSIDLIEVGQKISPNLDETDRGKWGGLIVLGNAPSSVKNSDTEGNIEGIPADLEYGLYGGNDPTDNSGIITYVSVRHGGVLIGEGNEINGITFGGVGAGTTVSHIEVVANVDDGIECFGGTVNIDNALVVFQGDDAIDLDQNYSGTIDNFYVLQDAIGDKAFEIDGPEGGTHTDGLFTLSNGTVESENTEGTAANLKAKAQGNFVNIAVKNFASQFVIAESYGEGCASVNDAYDNFLAETLTLSNVEVMSTAATNVDDIANVFNATDFAECDVNIDQDAVDSIVADGNNTVVTETTVGADKSVFEGWTWTSASGKL